MQNEYFTKQDFIDFNLMPQDKLQALVDYVNQVLHKKIGANWNDFITDYGTGVSAKSNQRTGSQASAN